MQKNEKAEALRGYLNSGLEYFPEKGKVGIFTTNRAGPENTPLERAVRAFYEKNPYHSVPPPGSLQSRIEALERDWANWVEIPSLRGKRTLDVGCGSGFNLVLHGALASVAVGMDVSLPSLENARRYCEKEKVSERVLLIHGDICRQYLPPASFDLITCIGVLHHIPRHREALRNMARLLDEGGYLLLGIYHPAGRLRHRVKRAIFLFFAGRNVTRRVRWARLFFPIQKEATKYRIPEEIYVRDSYAAPVEKAFSVRQVQELFHRVGLTLLQVRPSPGIGFREPVAALTALRKDEISESSLPPDVKLADRELQRMGRHHYWCLAKKESPQI